MGRAYVVFPTPLGVLWIPPFRGTVDDMEPNDAAVIGQRIRAARDAKRMSLDVFYAEMCARLPRSLWSSTEMIRRIETGKRLPEPVELSAMADALGIDVTELAPEMSEDFRTVRDLFDRVSTRLRCITVAAGQGHLFLLDAVAA